jgi:hypothetical protein
LTLRAFWWARMMLAMFGDVVEKFTAPGWRG